MVRLATLFTVLVVAREAIAHYLTSEAKCSELTPDVCAAEKGLHVSPDQLMYNAALVEEHKALKLAAADHEAGFKQESDRRMLLSKRRLQVPSWISASSTFNALTGMYPSSGVTQ